MLQELYILRSFYEESNMVIYEEDLRSEYGDEVVDKAIACGDIDQKKLFCSKNKCRCICWLSDKALKRLKAEDTCH